MVRFVHGMYRKWECRVFGVNCYRMRKQSQSLTWTCMVLWWGQVWERRVWRWCWGIRRWLHLVVGRPHLLGAPPLRQRSPHAPLGFSGSSLYLLICSWLGTVTQSVWGLVNVRQVLSEEIQQLAAGWGGKVEGSRGKEDRLARGRHKRGERGVMEQVGGGYMLAGIVWYTFIFL